MTNIENNICEAIELIVNKSIYEASYDKTIQGIVQSCEDATIGKYKIKYQDSMFYAYSASTEVSYGVGTAVYVLIPGNDMTKTKSILGTVDRLGVNYAPQAEGDEAYDIVGKNCILSENTYQLSSYYKPNDDNKKMYIKTILYFDDKEQSYKGDVKIDRVGLDTYLKESKTLICGGHIQTNLAQEQQYQGNYGIIFGLDFIDNTTKDIVTRYYTIDVDNMTGNPYNLKLGKRQYGIFTIDGANFDKISSISLFVKDFPNTKETAIIEEQKLFDITISNLELMGANEMSQEELNTCGISFYTPDGTIFSKSANPEEKLRITANVKVKGKLLNTNVQNLPFYWFQEDVSIKANSEYYNKYGGRGWKCLNNKNILAEETEESPIQVEWLPSIDTYNLSLKQVRSAETKIKCVVIYNDVFYSKTINIKNMRSTNVISIESDSGTQFYYDMGHPTLTCKVNGEENPDYMYFWGKEDAYGNFVSLPEDPQKNTDIITDYNQALKNVNDIEQAIKDGKRFANEAATDLTNAKNFLATFDKKQRVNNNKIEKVAVNEITDLATYKCSVFEQVGESQECIGTSSIVLANSLEMRDGYRLIINNGIQNFQYDEYGMGPTSSSLAKPQVLPVLTFTILDNLGRPIDQEALQNCDIMWTMPKRNSMLTLGKTTPIETEKEKDFYYFKNTLDLAYNIQKKYYYNYKNNDIILSVNYKGTQLTASTDFTFTKIGDAGTNGTEFTCKIVPNNSKSESVIPMFTAQKNINQGNFNFKYGTEGAYSLNSDFSAQAPFKLQLFKSGEKIFDGSESGPTIVDSSAAGNEVQIEWGFLQNIYKNGIKDEGYLTIDKNNGTMKYVKQQDNFHPAHILKCQVALKGNTLLFATLPIIYAEVVNDKYSIELKENTGFQSVIYTSDGVTPKYDNTYPFEVEVYKEINGTKELVSLLDNEKEGVHDFNWETKGHVYNYNFKKEPDDKWLASQDLINQEGTAYAKDLKPNQMRFKPANRYSGLCVTNAVVCSCGLNGSVGYIHIPIHSLLNKYGLAHLNDWDGNSIQVDKEGGFILSPQMGAGSKNENNAFTGILMGEVQHPNKTYVDTGLFAYNEGLQTIKLDAKNGSAIFGPSTGQIIIDPSSNKLMLYSSNYWKDYNEHGLPLSYDLKKNKSDTGMLIDLNTPMIDFGNGNFSVSSNGYLTAKGGGSIAGWNIDDDSLFTGKKNSEFNIQLSTKPFGRKMYNTDTRFDIKEMQKIFGSNNVSNNGELTNLALAFGKNFAVTQDGGLFASKGIFQGDINTKSSIKVGRNIYLDYDAEAEGGTLPYSTIGLNYTDLKSPVIQMWKTRNDNKMILRTNGDTNSRAPFLTLTEDSNSLLGGVQITIPDSSNQFKINFGKSDFYKIDKDSIYVSYNGKSGKGLTGTQTVNNSITTVAGLVVGVD